MRGRVRDGGGRGLGGERPGTWSRERLSHGWEWTDVTEPGGAQAHACDILYSTDAKIYKR